MLIWSNSKLVKACPDGTLEELDDQAGSGYWTSPDLLLRAVKLQPGIVVRNTRTGKSAQVVQPGTFPLLRWAPNSRFLLYRQREVIRDDTGKREKELKMLWLASVTSATHNTMCIALDSDCSYYRGDELSCAFDATKIAYTCRGRLYVAELAWRDYNIAEKLERGMPLTE